MSSYAVQGASSTPYTSQTGAEGTHNPFANANGPFANLDLTSAQQQQIASIFSQNSSQSGSGSSKQSWQQLFSQVESVLTPQQQQTFQSDLQQLRADHQHRGSGSGSGSGSNSTGSTSSSDNSQQSQGSQGGEEIDISITINISGYTGGVSTSA
jgi:Spy/CpxP family protein refolding chaperone